MIVLCDMVNCRFRDKRSGLCGYDALHILPNGMCSMVYHPFWQNADAGEFKSEVNCLTLGKRVEKIEDKNSKNS